ncbi:MAG: extracellular solute-binding protein [Proteobacteria bacterium]|nr:extracellular solute-binding protein [Pseudomonadota bacterium]
MGLTRRGILQLAGLPPLLSLLPSTAFAQERIFRHATTLFDTVKYGPEFSHFDYVNIDAPQGGRMRLGTLGSFDSLNPYTIKGDPASTGVNETLMVSSLDEASSEYGLIAESVWYPDDASMVVFRLRPEARFHDGEPIKPEDVIFSMEALKANHPQYGGYYKDVGTGEKTGDHEVTFPITIKGNRELPHIMGQLPVLPKHWWTGTDANGKTRDISQSTLEPPLGSDAYRVAEVKPGQSYRLVRVENYWGKDLPVRRGQHNFDEIEMQYYLDRNVQFEAFKGGQFDVQLETSSKSWATGYDFPAVKDGRVIKDEIPRLGVNGMQCWAMNLRRPLFQDARVRRALDLAFDFEWSNQNLFYGLYSRSRSFFNNSELEAKGLPSPEELALLEPLRDQVPPEVFTSEYTSASNATPQDRRKNMREAQALLAATGWTAQTQGTRQILKNAKGESFRFEILLDSEAFERIALPYRDQLALLGIDASVRTADPAQYERLEGEFNFDMIVNVWGQSLSPGNEQRDFFGSEFAGKQKSKNVCGIANPAIDALIDRIVTAPDRPSLITACRAMDRVLMWNHYVVPMWFKAEDWIAYWKRVRHPGKMPGYSPGYPDIWWFDAEADAELKKG